MQKEEMKQRKKKKTRMEKLTKKMVIHEENKRIMRA